jgi:hypothetical protein
MRKFFLATPVLVLALVACSDTANFQSQTEDFLESDEVAEADGVNGEVTDASCEEPESTDVGTTYNCTAIVEGRGEVAFVATIVAEDAFEVAIQP